MSSLCGDIKENTGVAEQAVLCCPDRARALEHDARARALPGAANSSVFTLTLSEFIYLIRFLTQNFRPLYCSIEEDNIVEWVIVS